MGLLNEQQFRFLSAVSQMVYGNPFLPERIALEKQALGGDYQPDPQSVWSLIPNATKRQANVNLLVQRSCSMADQIRDRLRAGERGNAAELLLYDDLIMHRLFYLSFGDWYEANESGEALRPRGVRRANWQRFQQDFDHYLQIEGVALASQGHPEQTYALLNQVCRAFFNIFQCVIGQSLPSARLRATIWESIFTFDMRRYRRCLFDRMQDIATLIVGPSGTGKDLVASAIGRSRLVDFDGKACRFAVDPDTSYMPLNLSAMSPGLIESELFGHAAGAFTGATSARQGWLQQCDRFSTVFLDEIGDLDVSIQVKLLRLLQNRQFQRAGETKTHDFHGKVITATNRDLESRIHEGKFREDFYYRLCSDVIRTPALHEQLADSAADLGRLIGHITGRVLGDGPDHLPAVEYVQHWIERHLPVNYHWPGNVRELEQCVRNVLVHNDYQPRCPVVADDGSALQSSQRQFAEARLSLDELQSRYCTIAYWKTGSFEKAARRLGIDRRTVSGRLDREFLAKLNRPEPDWDRAYSGAGSDHSEK